MKAPFDRATSRYIHAVVRADLAPATQAVQLAHAIARSAREGGLDDDCRFVMVQVPDLAGLHDIASRLDRAGVAFCLFDEPDHGIGPSALATLQSGPCPGRHLRRLKLWNPARFP